MSLIDVLCVGHACYDLVFSVEKHPDSDEKIFADGLVGCGGGPAANAAVGISRLGLTAGFSGYLGQDLYGDMHQKEFEQHNINTQFLVRGSSPTPLSTVIVKPDGKRALINYKGATKALSYGTIDYSKLNAKVLLFDGHEPELAINLIAKARQQNIPTILDAGSMHSGTAELFDKVEYLVASEKFACQYAGGVDTALNQLSTKVSTVVITLGEKGIIWYKEGEVGHFPAYSANIIDTTGAGDAFHGAFSAALALKMNWLDILKYASVAGTLCCTKLGARQGLPWKKDHHQFINTLDNF